MNKKSVLFDLLSGMVIHAIITGIFIWLFNYTSDTNQLILIPFLLLAWLLQMLITGRFNGVYLGMCLQIACNILLISFGATIFTPGKQFLMAGIWLCIIIVTWVVNRDTETVQDQ